MRSFTDMSPITYCFESDINSLIKIDAKRNITYHNNMRDKLYALKNRKKSDKFIIPWSGKWKTDVFEVAEKDIMEVLIEYNQ
jgi:hypothetical protein